MKQTMNVFPGTKEGAYWYENTSVHFKSCSAVDALEFVKRAKLHNTGAYAKAIIDGKVQVISFSPYGCLEMVGRSEIINLSVGRNFQLYFKKIEDTARDKARKDAYASMSCVEYSATANGQIEVSKYDTTAHKFASKIYSNIEEAKNAFAIFKKKDIPCRMTAIENNGDDDIVIRELAAANQHWHISMGKYAEQIIDGTLPYGETPYTFSNSLLSSSFKHERFGKYEQFTAPLIAYGAEIGDIELCNSLRDARKLIRVALRGKIKCITTHGYSVLEPWFANAQRRNRI